MSEIALQAVPRSIDTIRGMASTVRDALGYSGVAAIPAAHLIEFALPSILPSFVYDVKPMWSMGENHGLASPDHDYIAIREDVYEGACRGNGRDLFTIAHEVGHLVLHQQHNLVMRRSFNRPPAMFCQPEWQANTFAAELLMDTRLVANDDDEFSIARRFGVSITAARRRLRTLTKTGVIKRKSEPKLVLGSLEKS